MVESCENNLAACIQKNKFSIGDTLEAIEPGKPAFSFVVKELYDDKGQPIDAAPHPMQRVWVRLPQNVAPMAFLRRENKMDEKTTNI